MDLLNLDLQLRHIDLVLNELKLMIPNFVSDKPWHVPHALDLVERGKQSLRFAHEELLKPSLNPINSQK